MSSQSHGELLQQAAHGDQSAWSDLVDMFGPMLWSIARSFRLDHALAKDVTQTVWLRLVENIDKIRDPERLPGWLVTTCRRETLKASQLHDRTIPSEFEFDLVDDSVPIEELMIEDEQARTLLAAFRMQSESCQQLLRLLTVEPPLSYETISELIGRPVGSIGPTRARCVERLKVAMTGLSVG
jgi:RNA polymerase sigma factor (sigma-70 family)